MATFELYILTQHSNSAVYKISSYITHIVKGKLFTLLEKLWRISLYVTDDAIAKLNVT